MAIHHMVAKRAASLGLIIRELPVAAKLGSLANAPTGTVEIHWPQHNVYAYGIGSKPAMEQMEAILSLKDKFPTCHIQNNPDDPFQIKCWSDDRSIVVDREWALPVEVLALSERPWLQTKVPADGGEAHKAGFTVMDNPHDIDEEDPVEGMASDYEAWEAAWEASADEAAEAENAEDGEKQTGSVVSPKYRLKYAEEGHPNHCGDWLAETLNNFVLGDKKTDIETFERIALANGVDCSKYNHSTPGWQGRVRMTGRNLMAPRIFKAGGAMVIPPGLLEGVETLQAPPEWMAEQHYKAAPKK